MGWERENVTGSNSLPVSQSIQSVSRILRWVFNRAWVVGQGGIIAHRIGQRILFVVLRLDSFRVPQYVGLHGVCSFGYYYGCLGRESHNLWLGTARAVQPTLIPESRHRFRPQRKPY